MSYELSFERYYVFSGIVPDLSVSSGISNTQSYNADTFVLISSTSGYDISVTLSDILVHLMEFFRVEAAAEVIDKERVEVIEEVLLVDVYIFYVVWRSNVSIAYDRPFHGMMI